MRVDAAGLKILLIHCALWPEYIRLMIIAIISSIDVVDCFRKYLLDASVAYGFMFFIRMGIPLTSVSLLLQLYFLK